MAIEEEQPESGDKGQKEEEDKGNKEEEEVKEEVKDATVFLLVLVLAFSGKPLCMATAYASSKMESPRSLRLHPGSLARK